MIKQVILVPLWLGMYPGKVTSQCCHATAIHAHIGVDRRIILKLDTERHLQTLHKLHNEFSLNSGKGSDYNVTWSGFIDSAPTTENTEGKITAVSIVGEDEMVDLLTGHLELY